jgi:hypothetical protein
MGQHVVSYKQDGVKFRTEYPRGACWTTIGSGCGITQGAGGVC